MPTVNQLIEMVARETGLDDGSGSQDRSDILSAINRAYRRVCAEASRLVPGSADYTAALDTALSSIGSTLVTVDGVWREYGDRYIPLDRVSPERLMELRNDGGGTPTSYCVLHGTLMLDAIEAEDTSTIHVRFSGRPTALVDGGSEASIAGIDPIYHEDLLGTLAVCYVLEGAEGEEQRAAYFRGLVFDPRDGTLPLFKRSLIREGGVVMPRDSSPTRWDTPDVRGAR
jgi:hypothetical protein